MKKMDLSTININFNQKVIPFRFRNDSAGDRGVVNQIFRHNDYNIGDWVQGRKLTEYYHEKSKAGPMLIIDAGANIGASTIYFLEMYKNSFVYAIEPAIKNWEILELNTANYPNKINFHGAIAETDGDLFLEDPGYSDWGFRTTAVVHEGYGAVKIKSICPDTILASPSVRDLAPLILKIDIEGGEASLFSGDTSWMKRFPLIIIELHDWILPFSGSSRNFIKAVGAYDFDFVYRSENIFLFNREILAA
jgi:FkbM family methyltransferase